MAVSRSALVRVALAPVRAEPDVRAEQTSQEILGGALQVLARRDDWAHIRGEDSYEGWLQEGALLFCAAEAAEAWWDDVGGRPAIVLDASLTDTTGRTILHLPWGARVAIEGDTARLPDGREGRLAEGRWVGWDEQASRFPADPQAVVSTAWEWLGVPYIWGARTRWGTDCSGLVQAVYRLHGFLLPRDSCQQIDIGEPIELAPGFASLRPGDLVFFRGRETERVTHVALSLGGSQILHAAESNGEVMADDLTGDSKLQRSLAERLVGVRRLFA